MKHELILKWESCVEQGMAPLELLNNILEDLKLDYRLPGFTFKAAPRNIEIEASYAALPAEARRNIKRVCPLEVPPWAAGYSSKPMIGELSLGKNSVILGFWFHDAFICEPTARVEEIPPSEFSIRQAETLLALTPEQALAKVRAEAEELLKVRERPIYTCTPVEVE